MNIKQRLIDNGTNSSVLNEQVLLLTKIRDDIALLMNFPHLSKIEILSLSHMHEVLVEMKYDRDQALLHAVEAERTTMELKQTAVAQISQVVESLTTSGRIAFTICYYPGGLTNHHLTERADPRPLLGELLQAAIQSQAGYAASKSLRLGIGLTVTIDQLWQVFGKKKNSLEKRYATRIKSYEAQLKFIASHG